MPRAFLLTLFLASVGYAAVIGRVGSSPSVPTPPGGADTQLQYNNNGVFGGTSEITTNGSTLTLTNNGGIIFGNSDHAWFRYSNDHGGFLLNTIDDQDEAVINVPVELNMYSNTGMAGDGSFLPQINLGHGVSHTAILLRPDTAGQVYISTNPATLQASSILQVDSTTKGVLMPRMTTTQRDAIASPAEGLQIYNLTTHTVQVSTAANSTSWVSLN